MFSCKYDFARNKSHLYSELSFILLLLIITCRGTYGGEFDASVAPKGHYLFKFYPKAILTNAYFSNIGRATNLDNVMAFLYVELPVHLQYGLTGSISIGAILPFGWTYQEVVQDNSREIIHRLTTRELWLSIQHRWLALPVISSSSLRIKIPLAKKAEWEDGLRIGDGQVDIYPAYFVDYLSKTRYWYTELAIGYKYRFKAGNIKPFDEFNFMLLLGYELIRDLQLRFFIYSDLTWFGNGEFAEEHIKFYQKVGHQSTFGYGVSVWPRPSMRMEITTGGDLFGQNQFRRLLWIVGITKII